MFGTLMCNIQRRESLTFVENTDPASAFSRSQRHKPHTSCELCRKRKIRCNGKPTGCDKCIAISAECRYPDREVRRKKPSTGRPEHSRSMSRTSSSGADLSRQPSQNQGQNQKQSQSREQIESEEEQGNQAANSNVSHTAWTTPQLSAGMFGMEHEPQFPQQPTQHWTYAPWGDDGTSSEGTGGELAEGFDMESFSNQMLSTHLDKSHGTSRPEDTMMFDMFPVTHSPTHFESTDKRIMPHYYPSTEGLVQPMIFSPFHNTTPVNGGLAPPVAAPHLEGNNSTGNDAHSISSTALPASSGDSKGCRCLNLTARLLEELCTSSASCESVSIDVLLSYFRGALGHCTNVLDCEQCTDQSEHNMLLAMACQYMSTLSERLVMGYVELRDACEQDEKARQQQCNDASNFVTNEMWFSTYRIESACERVQVVRCLVGVQLTDFARLLDKLKARAGARKGHLVPLTRAEKRLKAVKAMMKTNRQPESASQS